MKHLLKSVASMRIAPEAMNQAYSSVNRQRKELRPQHPGRLHLPWLSEGNSHRVPTKGENLWAVARWFMGMMSLITDSHDHVRRSPKCHTRLTPHTDKHRTVATSILPLCYHPQILRGGIGGQIRPPRFAPGFPVLVGVGLPLLKGPPLVLLKLF